MVNSYTNTSQTISTNGTIDFNNNSIRNNCVTNHSAGTSTFTLKKSGYYYVTFNGTGATNAATAGTVAVQLQNNGVAVPGATSSATSASTTDLVAISFNTIIRVLPCCSAIDNTTNLTFVNTGEEAVFSNVNVTIRKIA